MPAVLFAFFNITVYQDKLCFLANHLTLALEILFKNRIFFISHNIHQTLSLRRLLDNSQFFVVTIYLKAVC